MLGVLLLLAAADPLTAPAVGTAATCLIVGRQLEYKVASADVLLVRAGTDRACLMAAPASNPT